MSVCMSGCGVMLNVLSMNRDALGYISNRMIHTEDALSLAVIDVEHVELDELALGCLRYTVGSLSITRYSSPP
ncbi:hypothetical protein PC123_g20104 [Phytophthora cactorum]|nr:hypothetical protein PC123_g20104 [Phytophthora cactorum]